MRRSRESYDNLDRIQKPLVMLPTLFPYPIKCCLDIDESMVVRHQLGETTNVTIIDVLIES